MMQKRLKSERPESSSSVATHRAWLGLWDSIAPGKVKTHTWRLIRNGLAVGSELQRRNIKAGVVCVACGREETNYHRFWGCYHSAKFWKILHSELGAPVAIPPVSVSSQGDLSNWLLAWFADASDDEKAVMLRGVYGLWLARNNSRDGRKIEEARDIAHTVIKVMEQWQATNGSTSKRPEPTPV